MLNAARSFEARPAVRESVPLLVGLMGPSGAGKTFSALRLATGIQKVCGGEIYCIDTEARRALHYADSFKFQHIQFDAPYGSLDYLAAIRHCVKQGARVIVIDSMTHEHTGPAGYLATHAAELDRMAGNDYAKRDRVNMAAWIKPAALRQEMITGILQLNANFVFCFRAKEKTRPRKGGGIEELGFMPVAGEELLFEMTCNILLLPKSGGVPTWRSDQPGERLMMKLPKQFEGIFAKERALDENIGSELAAWAKGSPSSPTQGRTAGMVPADSAPVASNASPEAAGEGTEARQSDARAAEAASPAPREPERRPTLSLEDEAREAAARGRDIFAVMWKRLTKEQRARLSAIQGELGTLMAAAAEKTE